MEDVKGKKLFAVGLSANEANGKQGLFVDYVLAATKEEAMGLLYAKARAEVRIESIRLMLVEQVPEDLIKQLGAERLNHSVSYKRGDHHLTFTGDVYAMKELDRLRIFERDWSSTKEHLSGMEVVAWRTRPGPNSGWEYRDVCTFGTSEGAEKAARNRSWDHVEPVYGVKQSQHDKDKAEFEQAAQRAGFTKNEEPVSRGDKPVITVTISGPVGSGKTTLAVKLRTMLRGCGAEAGIRTSTLAETIMLDDMAKRDVRHPMNQAHYVIVEDNGPVPVMPWDTRPKTPMDQPE